MLNELYLQFPNIISRANLLAGTSTNLVPELAGMLLPGRYAYLNPVLDRYIPENDSNAANLLYLQDAAANVDLSTADGLLSKYWQ